MVQGNQPGLQRAIYDMVNAAGKTGPDHVSIDYGRIIKRPLWVTDAWYHRDYPHPPGHHADRARF